MMRAIFIFVLLLAVNALANNATKPTNSAHFPQSLYYQGSIISPACIAERKSSIIDLDKCPDSYEGISKNSYKSNGEVSFSPAGIATVQYYTGSGKQLTITQDLSGAQYQLNYLGKLNGEDLILVNMVWFNGRGYQTFIPTELLSYARDGDQLIIQKSYTPGKDSGMSINLENSAINNAQLTLRIFITNSTMWNLMKNLTLEVDNLKYKQIANWVLPSGGFEPEYSGEAIFILDKLLTDSKDQAKYQIPTAANIIELQNLIGSVTHPEDLPEYKNVQFLEKGQPSASAYPFYENFYEYYSKGKTSLRSKEITEFVASILENVNKVNN